MYRPLFANQLFANLLLASLAIVLSACATNADKPTPLQLTIAVANDANPDETGRPSPVVLGVFDLAQAERFRDADYLALLSAPQKKLRSDLLDQHRLPAIAPGSQRTLALKLDAKANFIGVVAELAQFSDTKARLAIPLKPGRATTLKLIVGAHGITKDDSTPSRISTRDRFNDD
jgi:type VI secretion system protein VasD